MKSTNIQKIAAEFIGAMFLILIGCGTAIVSAGTIGTLGIALAFGLTLTAAHYMTAAISGGHLNPAVSFAFWLNKKLSLKDFLQYAVAQLAGALVGGVVLYLILSQKIDFNHMFNTTGYGPLSPGGYDIVAAGMVEALLSAFFILTMLLSLRMKESGGASSLVIGLAFAAAYLFAMPFTGASLNPARSFGVALVEMGPALHQLWFFFVMPMIGSAIAVVLEKIATK